MGEVRRLGQIEFIALVAMMFASIAFSVDTMLPALSVIGDELSPSAPNRAQFVVSSFVFGMGFGTLVVGPLSDAFGRKPVILGAAVIYFIATYISYVAQSMDTLIWARIFMGVGAAGPRAVGLAIVRDLYSGREMAKIMSFAMMVFSIVPAIGPLFGSFIIDAWGWREVFLAFIAFMLVTIGWYGIRQPETLPAQKRKRLAWVPIRDGVIEIFNNKLVVISILVLSLTLGMLFATLVTIQPVYDVTFGIGSSFPWWFALTSVLAMTGSIVNARYVERLGMRVLVSGAVLSQAIFALIMGVVTVLGLWPEWLYFPAYFIWATSIFWLMGLTIGNLNAMALEPMGHIAGLAASVVSATATVLSIIVATPIGLSFNGTPVPTMFGIALTGFAAYGLLRLIKDVPTPPRS